MSSRSMALLTHGRLTTESRCSSSRNLEHGVKALGSSPISAAQSPGMGDHLNSPHVIYHLI